MWQTNKQKINNYPIITNTIRCAGEIGLLEQQTSLLIAMGFLSLRLAIFSQTVVWPFMLAVLDNPALAHSVQKLWPIVTALATVVAGACVKILG